MCPFEELGCKFLNINSRNCRLGQLCDKRLCPFRHLQEEEPHETNNTNIKDAEISDMEDNDSVNFMTSTPRKIDCEECKDQSQCVDCYVSQENPSVIEFSH